MGHNRIRSQIWRLALAVVAIGVVGACSSRQPPAAAAPGAPQSTPAVTHAAAAEVVPSAPPLAATHQTWTAEAMEALLAPIALYPDPVLSQVLMASTNPQEVLDAGNWLIDHPQLADKALDQAAAEAGFTPPMRALMQFRQIVDQMCLKMGWTAELGQAFTNDQAGVLAAVQRLRQQAQDAGNLENSPQMRVETQEQGGQQAIVISPPNPQVVYVPQYDPMTAYASAPTIEKSGDGYGETVATGVLAFGAGLIVGNVFDDDADDYYHHRYYYPNFGNGHYPSCPPRYYQPHYGHGHRPGHYYHRPPHYEDMLRDNDFVVDSHRSDYWDHFDGRPVDRPRANSLPSPITTARMNRTPPPEFYSAGNAPTRRVDTMALAPDRLPGTPGSPTNAGNRNRGPQYYDGARGPQMLGSAQEPATYSAAQERQARNGDRQLPSAEDLPRQPQPAEARPDERELMQSRQILSANAPAARPQPSARLAGHDSAEASNSVRVSAPPPAPRGDGKRGNAGSGSRDAGRRNSASPQAHDSGPPAPGRTAGVVMQQQN